MHKYLMEARHFFRGKEQFAVTALNKEDAVLKGKEYIHINGGGNYDIESVRCLKKLKAEA